MGFGLHPIPHLTVVAVFGLYPTSHHLVVTGYGLCPTPHHVAVACIGLHVTPYLSVAQALLHIFLLASDLLAVVGLSLHCQQTFPVVVCLSMVSHQQHYTFHW